MKDAICYHGTTPENAASIKQTGFREDSWFARTFELAQKFGGPEVFAVLFPEDVWQRVAETTDGDPWQFHCLPAVPQDRIIGWAERRGTFSPEILA